MKTTSPKKFLSAFLAVVMVFLMIPFGTLRVSAAPDYSVPTTGHKLLSSYNVFTGTDISSEEADLTSSLDIFNRHKLEQLIRDYSSYIPMHSQYGEVHEGRDMESFAASAGVSLSYSAGADIGIEKLFKASVKRKIGLDLDLAYSEAIETYFYEYVVSVPKRYYSFNDAYLDQIKNYDNGFLSDTFINALTGADGSTPEEFFGKYGTHIITAYTAGGEAGISFGSVKTDTSIDIDLGTEFQTGAEASGTVFGVGLGMNTALGLEARANVNSDETGYAAKAKHYAHGGDDAVAFSTSDSGITFNFSDWVKSFNEENAMILVDERLEMIPIWSLLPASGYEDRIQELSMYFIQRSEQQDDEDFYEYFGIDASLFDYSMDWLNFDKCKIITNEEELNSIRNDLNGVYVLANNIVLSDYANWTPIGTEYEPFRGRLYGNYNTISGLNLSADDNGDTAEKTLIGLFGCNDGLITDLRVSGNISMSGVTRSNVYVGAIAAYNEGIISNCSDKVSYDIDYGAAEYLNLPVEGQAIEENKTYSIGSELGLRLLGQGDTTYSNVDIVVEESNNTGPVYIILENVNMVGSSPDGTIYNRTTRPIYIVSVGTSNSITGAENSIAINAPNADSFIFGSAELNIYGGNGSNGRRGDNKNNYGGNGSSGNNGASAIHTKTLSVNIDTLNIHGGNGGNGGGGGTGKVNWGAGHGGKGGDGGNGGIAVTADEVNYINGNIHILGGFGGSGGNGGAGYNMMLDPGHGGNGGNGGNGSCAVISGANVECIDANAYQIGGMGGNAGFGGDGVGSGDTDGRKGSAGMNASPAADIYIRDKRYALHNAAKTWTDAMLSAESNGAYLATITSGQEQNIINELISYGYLSEYYIGAYRAENGTDVWAWVTEEQFAFTAWNSGALNSSGDYVGIEKDSRLWNCYTNTERGYIEEYDLSTEGGTTNAYLTGIITGYNSDEGKIRKANVSFWNDNILQILPASETADYQKGLFEYFSEDTFDPGTVKISMYGEEISNYGISYGFSCNSLEYSKMECVKITKDDYERFIPVHVTKVIPDHIEISEIGQTQFAAGEPFDISGLSVKVVYNSGKVYNITENNANLSYTTPTLGTVGQTETVSVTYEESGLKYTAEYEVETVEDTVERIVVEDSGILTYVQGETLDFDEVVIREFRKSGQNGVVDHKYLTFEVSPSMCHVGECTVTVKHRKDTKISVSYTITVTENETFDHPWGDGEVTTAPTHLSTGIRTFHCTVKNCGASKTETIPPLEGHTYGDWYKLNDTQHQRACACGNTIVSDHVWDSGVITTPATHLTEGASLHACSMCDATETRPIEKPLEHTFSSSWTRYDDNQHSRSCECGEVEYADHNWNGEVTVEPTYTTSGLMTYACIDCSATDTEVIPILGIPENAPHIVVDSKNGVIGNTVTVKIRLQNNSGITSMRVNVAYDGTLLTLSEVAYNDAMGGQSVLPEDIDALNGNVILYWADGFVNYEGDGVFATLTFSVSDNAAVGTTTTIAVTYDAEDIYDADESNITFFCDDGVITLIDYIPGDINGDGVVNTKDTTRLMRYLSGWDVEVNEAALDVNGDDVVNTKDTTRLMRYLAGWNVSIF